MHINQSTDALIAVDVQNDFCPGGALAVDNGDEVVPPLNRIIPLFTNRVFTRDWHPVDHCSFASPPEFRDMSWPPHCIQHTTGAELHPNLEIPKDALIVNKATGKERDAYSGFQDTGLADTLRKWGVQRVFIGGLATDVCVRSTVLDARRNGFATVVLTDAVRAVDPGEGMRNALDEMASAGAEFAESGAIEPGGGGGT